MSRKDSLTDIKSADSILFVALLTKLRTRNGRNYFASVHLWSCRKSNLSACWVACGTIVEMSPRKYRSEAIIWYPEY